MEDIIKVSETEIQISIPQPAIVEVKSKDQLILERLSLIETKEREAADWVNRLASLDSKIAICDERITQATALEVKTQAELNII